MYPTKDKKKPNPRRIMKRKRQSDKKYPLSKTYGIFIKINY